MAQDETPELTELDGQRAYRVSITAFDKVMGLSSCALLARDTT